MDREECSELVLFLANVRDTLSALSKPPNITEGQRLLMESLERQAAVLLEKYETRTLQLIG